MAFPYIGGLRAEVEVPLTSQPLPQILIPFQGLTVQMRRGFSLTPNLEGSSYPLYGLYARLIFTRHSTHRTTSIGSLTHSHI